MSLAEPMRYAQAPAPAAMQDLIGVSLDHLRFLQLVEQARAQFGQPNVGALARMLQRYRDLCAHSAGAASKTATRSAT